MIVLVLNFFIDNKFNIRNKLRILYKETGNKTSNKKKENDFIVKVRFIKINFVGEQDVYYKNI